METLAEKAAGAAWEEAEAELAFWKRHQQEFLLRYPDQFVAVHDGEVVAAGAELRSVLDRIAELGIDPRRVWLHRFDTHPTKFVL
jgi:hypothetical protein